MEILKEVYNQIAKSLTEIIPCCEDFVKVILEIDRKNDSVDYFGFYVNKDGQKRYLNLEEFTLDDAHIHSLHNFITNMGNITKGWDRAVYRLFPKGKCEMDYFWDPT